MLLSYNFKRVYFGKIVSTNTVLQNLCRDIFIVLFLYICVIIYFVRNDKMKMLNQPVITSHYFGLFIGFANLW